MNATETDRLQRDTWLSWAEREREENEEAETMTRVSVMTKGQRHD